MRNYFLDYYKIMLAVFVVGIHTSPFSEYSKPLRFIFNLGVFKIAVPTFFLINGYYAINILSSKLNFKIYLIRVFKIYVFWMFLYFPLFLWTHDLSVKNTFWGAIILFYGFGHLWYKTPSFYKATWIYKTLYFYLKMKIKNKLKITLHQIT